VSQRERAWSGERLSSLYADLVLTNTDTTSTVSTFITRASSHRVRWPLLRLNNSQHTSRFHIRESSIRFRMVRGGSQVTLSRTCTTQPTP